MPKSTLAHQSASFMGLFWLTAPIAWLYALPVERFLDPLSATRANLALFGVVALWRVLLMARVIQVIQGASFIAGLVWVLVPACVEVMVISLMGFLQQIGSMMGGMRNSPEEDLLIQAFKGVFTAALVGLPTF
ncbi:MAG: hypothetical protein ACKPAH_07045, partial [Verrucomicrobiota bacterium]